MSASDDATEALLTLLRRWFVPVRPIEVVPERCAVAAQNFLKAMDKGVLDGTRVAYVQGNLYDRREKRTPITGDIDDQR